jgi:hypothetical protein
MLLLPLVVLTQLIIPLYYIQTSILFDQQCHCQETGQHGWQSLK